MENIILKADSYKYSMAPQYPKGTTKVHSYGESRGGLYNEVVFFGLQAFLKSNLSRPVTMQDVDEAEELITAHGEPFNRAGWEHVVKAHGGKLPINIWALPEGTVTQPLVPLFAIENTDDKCYWLTTHLETSLLRAVWYPTTVASQSYSIKQLIKQFLDETGDVNGLGFKLHDFGGRGVSSGESAALGGMAHLVNFMGSDTVEALVAAKRYYNAQGPVGFSIPAAEHSTITSWGKENEIDAFRNMVETFGAPGKIYAVVSDSYDIDAAVDKWGSLKDLILRKGGTLVVRPDSGDPVSVVLRVVQGLERHFGATINDKGFKVLNPAVRVIQGDGINEQTIHAILLALRGHRYSADNIAFGMGGALLQQVNRDTNRFAMKCSAAQVNGKWVDVFKDPVTDTGKRSKRGLQNAGMNLVYSNGELLIDETFESIRLRANQGLKVLHGDRRAA